jgi:hypothetical protein
VYVDARSAARDLPEKPAANFASRTLLVVGAIAVGLLLAHYWSMVLQSDGGGFGDAGNYVGVIFVSLGLFVFVTIVCMVDACTCRDRVVGLGCLLLIAFHLGGMWMVHHVASGIWQAEYDRNQVVAADIVDEINRYVEFTGATPESLADIGVDEPVILPLGGRDHELSYDWCGAIGFRVSYSTGWYQNIYESETGRWGLRD